MVLKIFVSYSHKDSWACDEFFDHIGYLQHLAKINIFSDKQIKPGSDWDSRILNELQSADIVVFLLTPGFLGSHYCTAIEMVEALDLEKKIFSVLVRNIDFDGLPLSRFQAFPKDRFGNLKAISDWHGKFGRDRAWVQVASAIRADVKDCSPLEPEIKRINWLAEEVSYERTDLSKISGISIEAKYQDRLCDVSEIESEIQKQLERYLEIISDYDDNGSTSDYFVHFNAKCTFFNRNLRSILIEVEHFFGGVHRNYDLLGVNLQEGDRERLYIENFIAGGITNEGFLEILANEIVREKELRVYNFPPIGQPEREELKDEIRRYLTNSDHIDFVVVDCDKSRGESGQSFRFLFPNYSLGSFAEGSYLVDIRLDRVKSKLTDWAKATFGFNA